MTQVAELLLEEGRKEGLILSGKIFRVVRECSDLTNERIAEDETEKREGGQGGSGRERLRGGGAGDEPGRMEGGFRE